MNVIKRDNKKENFDYEKINKVLIWATDGIEDVSASDIAMNAKLHLYDKISTKEIHNVMIESAVNMISEEHPNYQYVAARLLNFLLRKEVFNSYDKFPSLKELIITNVKKGMYDENLLTSYTDEEFNKIEQFIKHNRDEKFSYAGLKQVIDKYLVKDRKDNIHFETPQFAYILIACTLYSDYKKSDRLEKIKNYYDDISTHIISLPTPIIGGVRTPNRQYSSCVLIDVDDSLDSIFHSNTAIGKYISKRAGIGLNIRLRGINSKVRGGEVVHTGIIPFLKMFEKTVKSCSQGGIRGGAATFHYPFWHIEIKEILVLKNNRGNEDSRARRVDHSIQFSRLFYKRFLDDKEISLFSPNDVPDLYEAFGYNDLFDSLYEKYENDKSIRRDTIKARELMDIFCQEKIESGRLYLMNLDHVNSQSPFKDKIYMSNLCVSPETKILTSSGYYPISELEGEEIEIWNGREFSLTKVIKTGENQKLIKINFSNGQSIECTKYHKFYVQKGYNRGTGKNKLIIEEKRANELKVDDKIIKYKTPLIDFEEDFEDAYTQGFFSGDGCCYKGKNHIDLYGEKNLLVPYLKGRLIGNYSDTQNRHRFSISDSYTKFEVPTRYSIESKIKWLEGLCDSDGTLCRNGDTQSVQIGSIEKEFLKEIHLMLQTLGIQSKVTLNVEEGMRILPDNKGQGNSKEYFCQTAYRLLIGADGLRTLQDLGFSPKRLKVEPSLPNRNCEQFVKVLSIEDNNRFDDTYCVNEPLEHKVIFNGILTGNCQEIDLPTSPITNNINDGKVIEKIILIENQEKFSEFKKENELLGFYNEKNDNFILNTSSAKILDDDELLNYISIGDTSKLSLETIELVYGKKQAEIALCVLGGINLGKLKNYDKLEGICENIVRSLDYVIDIQDYALHAAEKMKKRRSLGVGVTNFAYWMAKNNLKYDDVNSLIEIDRLFEHIQYYLIKASVKLAKEYGACAYYKKTKWSEGVLPIDRYNKNVDKLVSRELECDWESLRADLLKYGIRNSTLSAIMPVESSSLVSNSTNGIEPPRALITFKNDKSAKKPVVVPEINKLKNKYQLAWSFDNTAMNNVVSVIQKWIDQGISVNHYYDKNRYEGNNLPVSEVVKDILQFYKLGGKQLYYTNSPDYKTDSLEDMEQSFNKPYENDDKCSDGVCML